MFLNTSCPTPTATRCQLQHGPEPLPLDAINQWFCKRPCGWNSEGQHEPTNSMGAKTSCLSCWYSSMLLQAGFDYGAGWISTNRR